MLQNVAADAQPCVWMCAGLISYRLCNRDFDCEHCPLDGALRGEHSSQHWQGVSLLHARGASCSVPEDRLYSAGHTWAQDIGESCWRFGIDAFAAALLGSALHVHVREDSFYHRSGSAVCTVDIGLGFVHLAAPFDGHITRINEDLLHSPALLITDPYEAGWLLELAATAADATELSQASQARDQMCMDLRRFRRALAFRLLAEVTTRAHHSADLQQINDLRDVVAGEGYVEFLREFVY